MLLTYFFSLVWNQKREAVGFALDKLNKKTTQPHRSNGRGFSVVVVIIVVVVIWFIIV